MVEMTLYYLVCSFSRGGGTNRNIRNDFHIQKHRRNKKN